MTLTALRDLMARVDLPPGLMWSAEQARISSDALYPAEAQAVASAVPNRIAEFSGGRVAARAALAGLGREAVAIPPGADRAPVFPDGVVGSISHDNGLCIALVGLSAKWLALGVDITSDAPLEAELIPEICTPEELKRIGAKQHPGFARRAFSAKEAVYKAQFPLTRTIFGFQGLCLNSSENVATFATIRETEVIPQSLRQREWPVVQHVGNGLILSICAVSI